jgi:hypothetical protein
MNNGIQVSRLAFFLFLHPNLCLYCLFPSLPPDLGNDTYTVGHAGVDYASFDLLNGYNPKREFGISLAVNSVTGARVVDMVWHGMGKNAVRMK